MKKSLNLNTQLDCDSDNRMKETIKVIINILAMLIMTFFPEYSQEDYLCSIKFYLATANIFLFISEQNLKSTKPRIKRKLKRYYRKEP